MIKQENGKFFRMVVNQEELEKALDSENIEEALDKLEVEYEECDYLTVQTIEENQGNKINAIHLELTSEDNITVKGTLLYKEREGDILQSIIGGNDLNTFKDIIESLTLSDRIQSSAGFIPGISETEIDLDLLPNFFNDLSAMEPGSKEEKGLNELHRVAKIPVLNHNQNTKTMDEVLNMDVLPIPFGFMSGKILDNRPANGEYVLFSKDTGEIFMMIYDIKTNEETGEVEDLEIGLHNLHTGLTLPFVLMIRSLAPIDQATEHYLNLQDSSEELEDIRYYMGPPIGFLEEED